MRTSQGRRKSEFPVVTSVASGSYFDLWKSGVNYQILDSNFYASLGVTGTIVQLGDPTGVPVLDIQGSVNRIRNLEFPSDSGLKGSVSALGGVALSLDAQGTGTGTPVLDSTLNKLRAIKAGSGIAVALQNGDIVVSQSATPATSNVVTVNALTDFPAAVGGVIPLAADTIYYLTNIVDVGALKFSLAANTVLTGLSSTVVGITSTASGILFSNAGGYENEITGIQITAPNATIFGISAGAGTADMLCANVNIVSCTRVCFIDSCFLYHFEQSGVEACSSDVFEFAGACSLINIQTDFVLGFTGTLFKLGTATFDRFNADLAHIVSALGTNKIIDGLVSSGNINVGGVGDVTEVIVEGSFATPATILANDLRWNFRANNFIADTVVDGTLSMQANAVNTVITVAGTAVLAAGTWVVEEVSKTVGTTAGRITYKGENPITLDVTGSLSVSPVAGVSQTLAAYIAVDGVVEARSKRTATLSAGESASITIPWRVTLAKDQYVEAFVANDTSTNNILVASALLRTS